MSINRLITPKTQGKHVSHYWRGSMSHVTFIYLPTRKGGECYMPSCESCKGHCSMLCNTARLALCPWSASIQRRKKRFFVCVLLNILSHSRVDSKLASDSSLWICTMHMGESHLEHVLAFLRVFCHVKGHFFVCFLILYYINFFPKLFVILPSFFVIVCQNVSCCFNPFSNGTL